MKRRWWAVEGGASIVEYALVLALIAVISISAITLVGRETKREFGCVALEFNHPGARDFLVERVDNGAHLTPVQARIANACL
jgi:Flp pilus assembly pilin Flp